MVFPFDKFSITFLNLKIGDRIEQLSQDAEKSLILRYFLEVEVVQNRIIFLFQYVEVIVVDDLRYGHRAHIQSIGGTTFFFVRIHMTLLVVVN